MLNGKYRVVAASVLGLGLLGAGAMAITSSMPTNSIAAEKTIHGSVLYRERMILPPEANLTVQLLDVSLADAPATVIAETHISNLTPAPIAYRLNFDPEKLIENHSYALQARISAGDTLWFVNDTRHAFDPANPLTKYDIQVVNVRKAAIIDEPSTLEGHEWLAEDILGGGVIDMAQTTLSISTSGEVAGSGGCNRYFGKSTVTGEGLNFGTIGATFMQCPPALMNQEAKFLDVLKETHSFNLANGKLYLLNEQGVELSRLTRNN